MGTSVIISAADERDAEQILKLQYLCYQSEAELYDDYGIEPLTQTLADLRAELDLGHGLVARLGDEIVASVRATTDPDGTPRITKLIVHPRMRRHGLGGRLLAAIEAQVTESTSAKRFRLTTGHRSEANLRLYRSRGYAQTATSVQSARLTLITLEKESVGAYVASA